MSKLEDENYDPADEYDSSSRIRPRLRSFISRGSIPIVEEIQDPETGEWRSRLRLSRRKFDNDHVKGIFLEEYAKWGRIGEAAAAAGVTTQTVRKAIEDDEDFAEMLLVAEENYRTKLIAHQQNLVFNGQLRKTYDRNGNLVSEETIYPIRLIELELKAHDSRYRDKQQVEVSHSGGVLIAPAKMESIEDWESKFNKAKDITPEEE